MDFNVITKEIIEGKITIKEALIKVSKQSDNHLLATLYLNKNVFIRTATHYHTGKLISVADGFLMLENASWIADTGRFNNFLKNGNYKECEPFPSEVCVAIPAIIDICEWEHELPSEVR